MRSTYAVPLLAICLLLPAVGQAQDDEEVSPFTPDDEANTVAPTVDDEEPIAPVEDEGGGEAGVEDAVEPTGESAGRRGPWPGAGNLQIRFIYQDTRLDLEAGHIKGTSDPVGTNFGNTNVDYDTRHTSARVEGAYGLGLGESIVLDLHGGVGWGTTALTVEADTASVLSPGGPDFDLTAESDAGFDLAFGADFRFFVSDAVFVGAGYDFLWGHVNFENQPFYNTVIDGRLDFVTHDIHAQVGYTTDLFTVWAGLGLIFYTSDLDLDEQSGQNRWDVELNQGNNFVKGSLGVGLHPGENISIWVQFDFVPDPSVTVGIGWQF